MKHYTADMREWAAAHRREGRNVAASDLECAADQMDSLINDLNTCKSALAQIDALDPESHVYGCSADALRGLVIRMGQIARTAHYKINNTQ